jgi:hypothetical protein
MYSCIYIWGEENILDCQGYGLDYYNSSMKELQSDHGTRYSVSALQKFGNVSTKQASFGPVQQQKHAIAHRCLFCPLHSSP